MKPIAGFLLLATASFFWTISTASAQFDDGWWFLNFEDTTGAALQPLSVGIDARDGRGFGFVTIADDDGDGAIHLPRVPDNSRLAFGVDADTEVGCDIWDLAVGTMSGGNQTTFSKPLLIIAEDVEGGSLGMLSDPFPTLLRALTPGERLTAMDGQLAVWPDLRLVRADSSVTSLEDFIGRVDTLPNFNGDVIVTDFLLTGTFVPEPGAAVLLCIGALGIAARRKRSKVQWKGK
jgi:hypothetical protein